MRKTRNRIITIIGIIVVVILCRNFYMDYYYWNGFKIPIKEPDRIKIYYSGEEKVINKDDKIYQDIIKLNKKRLINPIIVAEFDVRDTSSFIASNNTIELSAKYNNGSSFPIRNDDLNNLKKNINMIEYLYNNLEITKFQYSKLFNNPAVCRVEEHLDYTRILYTSTEGNNDLMIFSNKYGTYSGHGMLLKISDKLNNVISE